RTALAAAAHLPILRPLIGRDKVEIMAEARQIRTLALSELPDQDCCTLLTPRHVETRARVDDLRRIEARLDAADLAEELAGLAQEYTPPPPCVCEVAGSGAWAVPPYDGVPTGRRLQPARCPQRSGARDEDQVLDEAISGRQLAG